MKHIIARFKLSIIFNEGVDEILDEMIQEGMRSGISDVRCTNAHWISGSFNNGIEFEMWNANKWYGWLSRGRIGGYHYDDGRPKAATMVSFRDAVTKALNFK